MKKKYYLGIDQGTTGVAALLFDDNWRQLSRGYREITQLYPQNGWVEHDAREIWAAAQAAARQAVADADADPNDIACLGVDHEGESVVLWDSVTGEPVYNAIVWQDRRTAQDASALAARHGAFIRERTGLHPDAYFSATKLQWLLRSVPIARELLAQGRLLAGNMDAWLVWKLTGGRAHVTDGSTASRTMLFNIHTGRWDGDILALLGIDERILPTVSDSAAPVGYTEPDAFLGARIPITGMLNDQQAALFGQACVRPGDSKTTYGTGCFMLMNTGDKPVYSSSGLVTTVAWQLGGRMSFALDGGVYIAGAATQWLRDGLQIIQSAGETAAMAQSLSSNGDVYFVPAFTGLAAPHWDAYARGMMIGITGGTTREHIVRATLESTAYQVRDVLDVMRRDSGAPITAMRCDGGATANEFLMQFQADILGIPVEIPGIPETSALGAAYMAAVGLGDLDSMDALAGNWTAARRYEPRMSADERESLLGRWHDAVARAGGWAK